MQNDKNSIEALFYNVSDNKIASLEQSKDFAYTKRQLNNLCCTLLTETSKYRPEDTITLIDSYINSSIKLDRILYSEISQRIFLLNLTQRGIFFTNLEKLLIYTLNNKDNSNTDRQKIIVKIYDRSQLALHQLENTNSILMSGIEDTETNLQSQIKAIEKDYISILGIFAAIMLAFVGGITFSTSVLQNISNVSIYRLLIVIDLLGLILVNTVNVLMQFIMKINDKDTKLPGVKIINVVCICIAAAIAAAWIFNLGPINT